MQSLSKEQLELLNSPLPDAAIGPNPNNPQLSSIKGIYVTERFNAVFGIGGWTYSPEIIEAGDDIVIKILFEAPEFGIRMPAFGGNNMQDRGDAYKGAVTDALTKVGSYLNVGIDVFKGKSNPSKPAPTKREPAVNPDQTPKAKVDAKAESEALKELIPGTKNWDYCVKRLAEDDTVTIATIEESFRITPNNKKRLMKDVSQKVNENATVDQDA